MWTHSGYHYSDDGKKWLRIIDNETGEEWDEPIQGWELIFDMIYGHSYYRKTDVDFVVKLI